MPINKILNYLERRNITIHNFKTYIDYLGMIQQLYNSEFNELMAFPKDLTKAHDDMVNKFNTMKQEKEANEWKSIKLTMMKYAYQNVQYAVVIPEELNEVLQEGKSLVHCVGSYVQKIIKGETTILFIREVENINKPFYTLEYKNNTIVQCRGLSNKPAPNEINDFLKEWERSLKKKAKRKQRKTSEMAMCA